MNKVEKIKAEIDKLQSSTLDENINFKSQYDQGIFDGLSLLENFIDSLEEEPVSNDLEKAAWTYYDKNKPLIPHELDLHKEMISFFIAGAQWQKKQLIDKACDWLADNYSKYIITNGLATIFSATIDFDTIRMIEDFKKAMEE